MAANRLEVLKNLVEQSPNDTRVRYMLAMELDNTGDLEGAVKEYQAVAAADADYVAAYLSGGQALKKLGRIEEARSFYKRGIEACGRTSDEHTRSKLQDKLDALAS